MIRQLIRVAILVHENPSLQLVLVSLIHHCTETHAVMGSNLVPCFSFPSPLLPVLHFRAPTPTSLSLSFPLSIHSVPGTPHSFIFY